MRGPPLRMGLSVALPALHLLFSPLRIEVRLEFHLADVAVERVDFVIHSEVVVVSVCCMSFSSRYTAYNQLPFHIHLLYFGMIWQAFRCIKFSYDWAPGGRDVSTMFEIDTQYNINILFYLIIHTFCNTALVSNPEPVIHL